MNFKRLLDTPIGISCISIILGLGLATLFRKVCTDKNCIIFNGPVITDVQDKIYQYNDKCYQYTIEPTSCDQSKKIVDIKSSIETDHFQTLSTHTSSIEFQRNVTPNGSTILQTHPLESYVDSKIISSTHLDIKKNYTFI
jgi:hypothetical protein